MLSQVWGESCSRWYLNSGPSHSRDARGITAALLAPGGVAMGTAA